MRSFDVRIDITGTAPLPGPLEVATTVHLPDQVDAPLTVLTCLPGGGYGRGYYDLRGVPGYSQAEHHTAAGFAVLTFDHLGVGDSSLPDPFDLTFEHIAAANDAAVRAILERLRGGTLADGVPPIAVDRTVGMGQSMGGALLTVQQGAHATFDAVVFLGWSGIHGGFPLPGGGHEKFDVPRRGTDLRQQMEVITTSVMTRPDRVAFTFHWPEGDQELVEADMALYQPGFDPVTRGFPIWRSATTPVCAITMLGEGVVAKEAAVIDVPVLVASGERDIVPDPWAEPAAYRGSPDVSVLVVPNMAHMHNFAPTRRQLWDHIAHFARTPAPVATGTATSP